MPKPNTIEPATDEQVARFKVRAVVGVLSSDEALSLIARIEADCEENARLTNLLGISIDSGLEDTRRLKAEVERLEAEKMAAEIRPRCNDRLCRCCTGRAR